jgi:hypothetical protein
MLYTVLLVENTQLETKNIYKKYLDKYFLTKVIKTVIPINDEIITLLMHKNVNDKLTQELNSELEINLSDNYSLVKANVAIASAVTSDGRIHMIPFKIDGFCVFRH